VPEAGTQRCRVEVGHRHKIKPGNIVGAIANEAGIDNKHIGRISIYDDYSLVDLPAGMPKAAFNILKKARLAGRQLNIARLSTESAADSVAVQGINTGGLAVKKRITLKARPKKVSRKKLRKGKPSS
jgi:ATP-dependent RNA helicase DeaD